MDDYEAIKKIKEILNNWDLGDVKRAAATPAKMGTFILASCYIDHLSCFYFNKEGSKAIYTQFLKEFIPQYNAEDFRDAFRNKLVHNYSEGGKYSFTYGKSELHLCKDGDKTIINLEDLIKELDEVQQRFFELLDSSEEHRQRAINWYQRAGILGPTKIQPTHGIASHGFYTGTSRT